MSLMSCVSCCRFLDRVSLRSCWTCRLFSWFTLSLFFTLLNCFHMLAWNPEKCFIMEYNRVCPAVCASHGPGYQNVADITVPCDNEVNQVPMFESGGASRWLCGSLDAQKCVCNGHLFLRTQSQQKVSARVLLSHAVGSKYWWPCSAVAPDMGIEVNKSNLSLFSVAWMVLMRTW